MMYNFVEVDDFGYKICSAPFADGSEPNVRPYVAPDGSKPEAPNGGGMRKARYVNGSWVDEEADLLAIDLAEQSFKSMEIKLEQYCESVARQRRYDINKVNIWLNSSNPVYVAEAQVLVAWYEAFWLAAAQVEADVRAGTRTAPTYEELVGTDTTAGELPQLVWPI